MRRCAPGRTSETVPCPPPTLHEPLLHAAAFRRPRAQAGLVLAFKASPRRSSSETKTCPPPTPCRAARCSRVPWLSAGSGCLGEAREEGSAIDHVCVGATARSRVEHGARVMVWLAARGQWALRRGLSHNSRSLRMAGSKTQEAPLAVACCQTLEGDRRPGINASPRGFGHSRPGAARAQASGDSRWTATAAAPRAAWRPPRLAMPGGL